MIKKLDGGTKTKGGLHVPEDEDRLPQAEVILVSKEVEEAGIVKQGDIVYYMEPRESGLCKHKGEKHYIISVDYLVAIV